MFNSGLVKFSPDLHVIPELAVSIPTISTDGRSYTFTIRQDARFADGSHCTARAVAYSFARALGPRTGSALARSYLGGIVGADAVEAGLTTDLSGVQIVHRLTVRIRLAAPDATFLEKLAFPVADIVEPSTGMAGESPSGLGPWSIAFRHSDGSVTALPRRHYYGAPIQLKEIRLLPAADSRRALELYRQNLVDVAQVPRQDFRGYSTRSDFVSGQALDAYYALPTGPGRTLLAASLDRSTLATALGSAATPLSGIVPPAIPDYAGSDSPATAPGSDASRRPPAVQLVGVPGGDALGRTVRGALLRQWTVRSHATTRVFLVHAGFALPDPGVWLRIVLLQTRSSWYRSMLAQANALTNDPVSRMSDYETVESWALQQGLVIPLASGVNGYVIRSSVENLQLTPLGPMPENNNWSLVATS